MVWIVLLAWSSQRVSKKKRMVALSSLLVEGGDGLCRAYNAGLFVGGTYYIGN